MKNFLKVSFIYIVLMVSSFILNNQGIVSELNCFDLIQLKIFFINIIIMIALFRLLKVERKSILVFLVIISVLLTIISIDSSIMFGPNAKYGVYSCNIVVPEEFWVISFLLSYPFSGIFTPFILGNIVNKSIYIVPIVMAVVTFIITKVSTIQLHKKSK